MAANRETTIYAGGFGERMLHGGAAMTPDTVVWIASMTKPLTSVAAMLLVEQGKLELDAPARNWLPELADVQVLEGFDGSGAPVTRAPSRPITLRHLLTHTAGFAYEFWSEDVLRYQQAKDLPQIDSCENAALTTPLLFDPGERWCYGINSDWAGKMVEAVSGQRLGAFMTEHILKPLGMASTAFKITPDMRARLAKVHQRGDDGTCAVLDTEVSQEPEFEMGGGGLYSTVGDYLRFVRLFLNRGVVGGRALLKPDTVEALSVNQMGDCRVSALQTAMPGESQDAEFFPGMPQTWSLGFMINMDQAPTGRSAGSLAWAGLANTYFWIDPVRGIGGVYATQVLPFADDRALSLYNAFEAAVYAAA